MSCKLQVQEPRAGKTWTINPALPQRPGKRTDSKKAKHKDVIHTEGKRRGTKRGLTHTHYLLYLVLLDSDLFTDENKF